MNRTHPRVDAYLEHLDALLAAAPPRTRSEVVAGVREHLRDRLEPDAEDERVEGVLADLGTPEQIADEAYAAPPRDAYPLAVTTPRRPPTTGRRWVPATVLVLSLVWLLLPAGIGVRGAVDGALGLHPSEAVFLLFAFPVWPVTVVLVVAGRAWRAREKLALVLALPGAIGWLALVGLVPGAGLRVVLTVVGIAIAATTVVALCRRALRRTPEPARLAHTAG